MSLSVDRRTRPAIEAEDRIRQILDRAEMMAWSAKATRRELRDAYWGVVASRSLWYAALRRVTGGGVLDIRDARQPELVARGPRSKRRRQRKVQSRAA